MCMYTARVQYPCLENLLTPSQSALRACRVVVMPIKLVVHETIVHISNRSARVPR